MAATVLHTVLRRINPGFGPWPELTQFRRPPGHSSSILARPKLSSASRPEPGNMARTEPEITAGFIAEDFAVPSEDRPPMIEVPEYWRAHARI
jgi:hypothetical protein